MVVRTNYGATIYLVGVVSGRDFGESSLDRSL